MNSVVGFLRKPLLFLGNHRKQINGFLPYFFLSYFIFIFLPYVVADVPAINSFFLGSVTRLVYRAFTTVYFCFIGCMFGYINKAGIKWWFVIGGIILLICYGLSITSAPRHYSYVVTGLSRRVEFYTLDIGPASYVTYGFSFLADIVSFVIFISYIPLAMNSIKQLYLTLIFLVSFMLFACVYSLIKEHNQIVELLKGSSEYEITVRSLFHSKNAFGLYLFVANISAAFLLVTIKTNIKWVLLLPMVTFTTMTLLSMCKSALLCCLILDLLLVWFFAFFSKGVTFYVSLILTIISICVLLGLVVIFSIPSLRDDQFLKLYSLFEKLFNGLFSRTDRWVMAKYVVYGPFIVIGMNETNATYFLEIMSKVLQDIDVIDFHSGYVTWYAHHGIVGCILYGALLIYIIYKIIILSKFSKRYAMMIAIFFLSCLVFMIPESYVLFISISSYSFIINLIIICSLECLTKKKTASMGVDDEV